MGSFAHHISGSVAAGVACGAGVQYLFNTQIDETLAVGLVATLSGFIADFDAPDSSNANHTLNIACALAPPMILQLFNYQMTSAATLFLITTASYLIARIVFRFIVKHIASHRGMFHSFPAVIIWSLLVFLDFKNFSETMRLILSASAGLGYIVHLLIDSTISQTSSGGGAFEAQQYSGTALKMYSSSIFANIITYGMLMVLTILCLREMNIL